MINRRFWVVFSVAALGFGGALVPGQVEATPTTELQPSCVEGEVKRLCEIPDQNGDCSLGVIRCEKGSWSPCVARYRKTAERCGLQPHDGLGAPTGDEDCDGLVDEFEPYNPAINCVMYMIDADGDGYGAIGESYDDDPVNGTYGCFCPGKSGAVPLKNGVPAKGKQNLDCGDCRGEGGKLVHPGVTDFFEGQSECLNDLGWKGGIYDYDCSGYEEREHLGINGCDFNESGGCSYSGSGYWAVSSTDDVPKCGTTGFQNTCQPFPQPLADHEKFCYLRSWVHPLPQMCR